MALNEEEVKTISEAFKHQSDTFKTHEQVILNLHTMLIDARKLLIEQDKRLKALEEAYMEDKLIGKTE